MRFLMDFCSGVSYFINQAISSAKYKGKKEFDFEEPLMRLIWIAAILCISTSFFMSYMLIGDIGDIMGKPELNVLWWQLALIISCGTLAAVLIPEFTKIFTSAKSKHVNEIVTASKEGGASLTILSGIVAGNFSAFWIGMLIVVPHDRRLLREPQRPVNGHSRIRVDIRLRPCGLRLPLHGPGQHRC